MISLGAKTILLQAPSLVRIDDTTFIEVGDIQYAAAWMRT